MTAYSPEAWETFFAANAGAAAALAGLLFVGVSINIQRITESKILAGRTLEAFVELVTVLIVSVLGLVPAITDTGLGIALLIVGGVVWLLVTWQHLHSLPRFGATYTDRGPRGSIVIRILMGQVATLTVLAAGVTLIIGSGGGLFWLVGAIVTAYVSSLANAWVLLVEILR